MARYRRLRQHRYEVLGGEGFTRAEAQVMSEFKFKQPYIRLMRQERSRLVGGVRRLGLPRREALGLLRRRIDDEYRLKGWKDAYAMMRYYRKIAIEEDLYIPPPFRKRKPIDRGDVVKQRERYKARKGRGAVSSQYDAEGRLIGDVVFDPRTGRFQRRLA